VSKKILKKTRGRLLTPFLMPEIVDEGIGYYLLVSRVSMTEIGGLLLEFAPPTVYNSLDK
jgi:hypothetical protein